MRLLPRPSVRPSAVPPSLPSSSENVYTLLRVFSRLDIPFYAGARQPLVADIDIVTWIGMGVNGLGDATFAGKGGVTHTKEEYALEVGTRMRTDDENRGREIEIEIES